MNKFQIYFTLIFFAGFLACKKDTGPVPPAEPSAKYKALTSHYWRLTGKWHDTTDYAKGHPEAVPTTSSMDEFNFIDSCTFYTSFEYNTNGKMYSVEGNACGCQNSNPCKPLYNSWSLINHDQIIRQGATGYNEDYTIITLNDTILKVYKSEIYNFTKTLVAVYRYQPYIYK